ncbi:metallopeptidase family protein [Govanella unica]|uniref:Metallopeptidase family protein n=1 Tax=Govanella unica TaxID=2975056 RepID=A0A9X3TWS2_9PROT|nr:metallopeptidase family protein [Govania unica]MDA5192847.1 metallopeptidase family protein [Govania unica]
MTDDDLTALDAEFEATVRATIAALPEPLASACKDVVVMILDFADDDTLNEMEIDDPYDLLGLYRGVSLDQRSINDIAREPDMVFLYRLPIFDYAEETGEALEDVVRHVTIHEIGHHFGFSDETMEAIEAESTTVH